MASPTIPHFIPPSILNCTEDKNILSGIVSHGTAQQLFFLFFQASVLLSVVPVLRSILRFFYIPEYFAEITTGLLLGPSALGSIPWLKALLFSPTGITALQGFAWTAREVYAFMAGLEMDISLVTSSSWHARSLVLVGWCIACGMIPYVTDPLQLLIAPNSTLSSFRSLMVFFIANTGSTTQARHATELKLAITKVGQLGVSTALLNDVVCLTLLALASLEPAVARLQAHGFFMEPLLALSYPLVCAYLMGPGIHWMVGRNRKQRIHISDTTLCVVLAMVTSLAQLAALVGYPPMMCSVLLGMFIPRNTRVAPALLDQLYYPVRSVAFPMYCFLISLLLKPDELRQPAAGLSMLLVAGLAIAGKVATSLSMGLVFKAPLHESLMTAFLLSIKGFPDLLLIIIYDSTLHVVNRRSATILTVASLLSSFLSAFALLALKQYARRGIPPYMHPGIERQGVFAELRVLACLHSTTDVPTAINYIEAFRGSSTSAPLAAYTMHLIEYNDRIACQLEYRHDNSNTPVGADAEEIAAVLEAYVKGGGTPLNHTTAISFMFNMHQDVCTSAEDVKASIVVLPFHMFQRLDGKMQVRSSAHRAFNRRVLEHAPCTVGVLACRGLGGTTLASATGKRHRVTGLFFGGPDDREALALGGRMAEHPNVSFRLVRFICGRLHTSLTLSECGTADGTAPPHEKVEALDEEFLDDFCQRYVESGRMRYEERMVSSEAETVDALRELDASSELFLVGQGTSRFTELMISGSEECPELGPIGDLLSCSDYSITSSVLVVKQRLPLPPKQKGGLIEASLMTIGYASLPKS